MSTFDDLKTHTKDFMEMHWPRLSPEVPEWNDTRWTGTEPFSMPNYKWPGCYAFLDEKDQVAYIGVGVSRGGGLYPEHGISRRVIARFRKEKGSNPPRYVPMKPYIKSVVTIGFEDCYCFYLAPALETYLILKLNPPHNHHGTGRSNT